MALSDTMKRTPDALDRNIEQIAKIREKHREQRSASAKAAEALVRFIGSPISVYLHAAFLIGWIAFNSGAIRGITPLDPPPFSYLNVFTCCEAIFLTMFVLIRQRRTMRGDEKRSELDLQMGLLTEHELTRLVRLVNLIAHKVGVDSEAKIDDLSEVMQEIDPADVIERMEQSIVSEH